MTVFHDPLNQVLNGEPAPFVPVAPVYENLGPLEFRRMELKWQQWQARLRQAGTDRLAVDSQTCLDLSCAVETELIDTCYSPPAWQSLPYAATPDEVASCAVERRGEDLYWVAAEGRETWLPPNRVAYHARLAEEKTHRYAHFWEAKYDVPSLESLASRPEPLPASEPTPAQVEAELASGRYELLRFLQDRYRGSVPFYYYACSPYGSLLGWLGFQGMMEVMAERPDLLHPVLESSLPKPSAALSAAYALGLRIVFMEECLSSADLISPRMYREFAHPYTRRALQFFEDRGFRTVLYFSGNLMPLLSDLNELPFTALSFEEDRKNYGIDLAEVRRALPGKVLFGNVDAMFLESASDAEVVAEVRRQIGVAGQEGRYVLSPGSPFTPRTSLERVRLFCESTQRL